MACADVGIPRHQRKLLHLHPRRTQHLRRTPLQLPVAVPAPERGQHLGAAAVPHPPGEHHRRGRAQVAAAAIARRPEVVQVERLQLVAAEGPGHHLPLVPALGLGVPLALPQQAVVLQEGVGGAVGVVDCLDAAGVGHGTLAFARPLESV